ncbi:MAG: CRISPR system precrRNA processing endoribonuclease RAMP protein Cas6 [Candidatus Methanosuratus sp.]|nr:CRISPR system precrRNA processing endoribonuclease RAMP protein Cas6 [Candidatus Methanosuratincola sp.]
MPDTFLIHHLRFNVEVEKTIIVDAFKGSALRGAWQSHLRTLYCARAADADPLHQAMCPVCFLLSRETGSGDDRRPYAFEPPLTEQTAFQPGERFQFGISIFGSQTVQFLPYIVLAVGQMGRTQGLGRFIHGGKRGTFRLVGIEEINPLTGAQKVLLEEGGAMVHMPAHPVTGEQIERVASQWPAHGSLLGLQFLTPTRIVDQERLVHRPHFAPLFARLLDRITALQRQFAEHPPLPWEEKRALLALADQVELVVDQTRWWDVQGRSTRLGRRQPLGGYVGRAVYRSPDWKPLLPWLLWGQSTHLGKNVVKGAGWYEVATGAADTLTTDTFRRHQWPSSRTSSSMNAAHI